MRKNFQTEKKMRLFGKKKTDQNPTDPMARLNEVLDVLEKRRQHLETKARLETQKVKADVKNGKKTRKMEEEF